jgi:hypothetical protein
VGEQSTLRDGRRTYHFWLHDAIFDTYGARLGPLAGWVYTYLARRAKEGMAFPSLATIAKDTGMSARSVIRCLKTLETLGLMRKETRKTVYGGHTSNLYELCELTNAQEPRSDTPTARGQGCTPKHIPTEAPKTTKSNISCDSQALPYAPESQPLMPLSHNPSDSQAHKGFSLKETQSEGTHTPAEPENPKEPKAAPSERVCETVKAHFQFFPIETEAQSALRALVLTDELATWAQSNGINLDLAAEFEHWLNDGVSNGRRKRDFVAAFKCWLQSPLRVKPSNAGLSRFEQKKQIVEAAGRRFVEEIRRERERQTPVHDHDANARVRVPRPIGQPPERGVLARLGATLHAGAI